MMNKNGDSGHLCLFLILEEMPSVLHWCLQVWEWCYLWVSHIWSLLCWGRVCLCPPSREHFHKQMLNFIKNFFCIYWNDHMVFILQFVNVVYHTDWLVDTEKSVPPWGESQLILVYDSFNVLLNLLCLYLVEDFFVYVLQW